MKLYHGTSSLYLARILRDGLKPRGKRAGNWESVISGEDRVYLSDAYAYYYAANAVGNTKHHPIIVEVDVDEDDLVGDDDFLEQVTRGRDDLKDIGIPDDDMRERTHWYRDHAADLAMDHPGFLDAETSLRMLGTCAHIGPIPKEKITKIISVKGQAEKELNWLFDPVISLAGYRFVGKRYRWYNGLLVGTPSDKDAPDEQPIPEDSELRKTFGDFYVEFPKAFPENVKAGISLVYSAG